MSASTPPPQSPSLPPASVPPVKATTIPPSSPPVVNTPRASTPPDIVTQHSSSPVIVPAAPPRASATSVRSAPRPKAPRGESAASQPSLPREPIYLASQLASVCDVDLKTIHNWCDRSNGANDSGALECFRTPGGHLRFCQSAVLRFLNRWGYPIPDSLLRDRPHLLLVEPDVRRRQALLVELDLRRPGDERSPFDGSRDSAGPLPRRDEVPGLNGTSHAQTGSTGARQTKTPIAPLSLNEQAPASGLFANERWYVHLWDDAYTALVAVGERVGSGAQPDLAVLPASAMGLAPQAWMRATRALAGPHSAGASSLRFALMTDAHQPEAGEKLRDEPGVVGVVGRDSPTELRALLDQQGAELLTRMHEREAHPELVAPVETTATEGAEGKAEAEPRKRRAPIAPREPIYVASQVAQIWNVDLKTVHNWVERGEMEAFCTPGRHLRFRRRSLLHFLRRYNMAIPEDLAPARPRIALIDRDREASERLAATLTDFFDVVRLDDPIGALVELGARCAGAALIDAVVVSFPAPDVDASRWVEALSRHADTRYTRVVVVADDGVDRARWQQLGVIATPHKDSLTQVGAVLEQALGIEAGV